MTDFNDTIDLTDVPERDLKRGAIAGIVIAVLIALLLLILIIALVCRYYSFDIRAHWIQMWPPNQSYAKVNIETQDVTPERGAPHKSDTSVNVDTHDSTSEIEVPHQSDTSVNVDTHDLTSEIGTHHHSDASVNEETQGSTSEIGPPYQSVTTVDVETQDSIEAPHQSDANDNLESHDSTSEIGVPHQSDTNVRVHTHDLTSEIGVPHQSDANVNVDTQVSTSEIGVIRKPKIKVKQRSSDRRQRNRNVVRSKLTTSPSITLNSNVDIHMIAAKEVGVNQQPGEPSCREMITDTGSSTSTSAGIPPQDASAYGATSSLKANEHVNPGISEMELHNLAEKLGNHTNLPKLALKFGFKYETWLQYKACNTRRDGRICIDGTLDMLIDWYKKTPQAAQKALLNAALEDAGFAEFADSRDELLHDGKENPPKTDTNHENNGQTSNASQEEADEKIKRGKEQPRKHNNSNTPAGTPPGPASEKGVDTVKQGDNELSRGHEHTYKPEDSAPSSASQERDDFIKQEDTESNRGNEDSNKPEESSPYAASLEGVDTVKQVDKESSRVRDNYDKPKESSSYTASHERNDIIKQGDKESIRRSENSNNPEESSPYAVVLVTDASGFVASHIVMKLLEKGCKVRATLRKSTIESITYLLKMWRNKLELVEADFSETSQWEMIVQGCTHVIHTAELFPDKFTTFTDKMAGQVVSGLLKTCLNDDGVKRVIVTGSCDCDQGDITKKSYSPKDWENLNSILKDAYWKTSTENEALRFDVGQKRKLSIIRSPFVMGPIYLPVEDAKVEMVRLLMDNKVAQNIHFPMCDVRDVAKAYIVTLSP